MFGTWEGGGWPMMGFGWMIFMVLMIACMVLMFWMHRRHGGMPCLHHGHVGDRALNILRERYAKGEINKADFDRMRQELG